LEQIFLWLSVISLPLSACYLILGLPLVRGRAIRFNLFLLRIKRISASIPNPAATIGMRIYMVKVLWVGIFTTWSGLVKEQFDHFKHFFLLVTSDLWVIDQIIPVNSCVVR
jgi:hypothetical protein